MAHRDRLDPRARGYGNRVAFRQLGAPRPYRDDARAEPPPEATVAAYRQIEHWLPAEDEQRDNILVLTRKTSSNPEGELMQKLRWQGQRLGTVLSSMVNLIS